MAKKKPVSDFIKRKIEERKAVKKSGSEQRVPPRKTTPLERQKPFGIETLLG